ncbi:hypothetical protein MBM_03434 [Drepanopeziza brunnea f. sp. 'multigermtubi' MB_m1]|uniref:DUF202 domain-containing protein n=1 Tax=Marssonina brunnea f. sp. multigermtubi (strain MB_m1) TaxID=1072389 RepID=K1WZL4_MARBU|nr:uncharacterized protein MBM_03434 [Drepanopeziza brunnea f. sp. 'multigermtubi' MB_m1]EKD18441.1 hypothetical protein MBM_03434 [Drepanopeziza brunnea f. sp. 'multigermtubi' MB_m1]
MATSSEHPAEIPEEPHLAHITIFPVRSSAHRNARESTELERIRTNYSRASSYHQRAFSTRSKRPESLLERFNYALRNFWRRQISIDVDHGACRDHLALERTFLGYLRTSLALSMLGAIVAQLYRLQLTPTPNPGFGFFVLGKPLSIICQGSAIYTLLLGAFRIWRMQNAIVRGKAITGGFEIVALAAGFLAVSTHSLFKPAAHC